jgi:pimeloyl-ACP methyl ester carboxylesterase
MKSTFLIWLSITYALNCFAQVEIEQDRLIDFKSLTFKLHSGDTLCYDFGMLKVLENRSSKHSKVIELAVLKLKAKNTNSNSPIVFLSGGPGESGIDYIKEEYFQELLVKLQKDHDIILLDQRGTGRSLPSLRFILPDSDNRQLFFSKDRIIQLTNEAAEIGAADLKVRAIDIRGYNTLQSTSDLNDLRLALNTEKLNLLAFSYGTHLALATAKVYPDIIDKMILVGPSGLNHMHHLPSAYDKQLIKISHLAAQDSSVSKHVPDMLQVLKRILHKLEKEPLYLPVKDFKAQKIVTLPISKFGLQLILRFDTGDSNDFIYFPALLYGIENGDYRLLQKFAERRYNQFNGGYGSGIFAIRQASGATKERYDRILKEGKTAWLGNTMNTPDIFAGWKNVDLGDEFRKDFNSDIKTLFVSGSLDSNTPSSNVDEIIKGFSNAFHIVVTNAGHEDMLPSEEVHAAITYFIRNETIEDKNLTLPKPKFIPIY